MASSPSGNALDTAGWVDFAAAKAWGALAVGMYVDGNLLEQTTAPQDAAAAGVGIWSFLEFSPSDPLGGAPQGGTDANNGLRFAEVVHQPAGSALYVANDEAVPSWGYQATLEYFQAVAGVINQDGRWVPGFYGQQSIWDAVKGFGFKYFAHAPDGTDGPWPEAHILCEYEGQANVHEAGMFVDVNLIQTPDDYGGWNAQGLWPLREVVMFDAIQIVAEAPYEAGAVFLNAGANWVGPLDKAAVAELEANKAVIFKSTTNSVFHAKDVLKYPAK